MNEIIKAIQYMKMEFKNQVKYLKKAKINENLK